jgi:outer membrane protein TolC
VVKGRIAIWALIPLAWLLAGCHGVALPPERASRARLAGVSNELAVLPTLGPEAALGDYLRFAMLNQPTVRAAFADWQVSVERITVERSRPDPQLTFQAYIQNAVTSVMPGLMQALPGPGKLKAAGNLAAAESDGKFFAFEAAALRAAFGLKQAFYQIWFLDEKLRIDRATARLLTQLEQSARAQNEVGKVTLQDVYRAQIEEDRLQNEITNLEDARSLWRTKFKAALGRQANDADPPLPSRFESTPLALGGDEVLTAALAQNPTLKMAEAEVRAAEAAIAVARKTKIPDFTAGLSVDAKAAPIFYWPQASMTLPIWRDKIAAQIAGAQAQKRAAEARLSAAQIDLTVDFAAKAYDYRENTRALALLGEHLIPKARQSLEIARAGYLSGGIDFFNLIDAERSLLNFQLEEAEARSRREITLAEISLSIAGIAPAGAPFYEDKP